VQSKEHWEQVYSSKNADEVSWFQKHAALSLRIIRDNDVAVDGKARKRLGAKGSSVSWVEADVLEAGLLGSATLWNQEDILLAVNNLTGVCKMGREQKSNKETKKKPSSTPKEKKQVKKEKKKG
jgi:hypothetical protein